jgi:monothiol glutaredoxin
MSIQENIKNIVKNNDVVLFMKGTKVFPQCGFSSHVVHVLNSYGVDYKEINVLDDNDIRQGIKEYSNWPTIPQLYLNQEFVGGCDIVTELHESGELKVMLDKLKENS